MARRPLTRDRIVDKAIRLADRRGFDHLTLRRLADELGVHVTSLYNHIPTYEAVVDAMVERLLVEAKLPSGMVTWERWVKDFIAAVTTMARTHPGAFGALQHRPVQGPQAMATFEAALGAFRRAGLAPVEAYSAVKAVALAAVGLGVETAGLARGNLLETDIDALSADDFPYAHELVAVGDDADASGFLTDALVAGIAVRLRRARSLARSTGGGA